MRKTKCVRDIRTKLTKKIFIFHLQDSTSGTPVTMRVDSKGFYLCWIDQNNESDILDMATVRDVRTGQFAKKPRVSFVLYLYTFDFYVLPFPNQRLCVFDLYRRPSWVVAHIINCKINDIRFVGHCVAIGCLIYWSPNGVNGFYCCWFCFHCSAAIVAWPGLP